jgi:hypothetical protein
MCRMEVVTVSSFGRRFTPAVRISGTASRNAIGESLLGRVSRASCRLSFLVLSRCHHVVTMESRSESSHIAASLRSRIASLSN